MLVWEDIIETIESYLNACKRWRYRKSPQAQVYLSW